MAKTHPIISVNRLTKRFSGHLAIDDISLTIESGDIFGIIGESGAGKSTLIRCLSTLEKPTSGSIHFEGEEITQNLLSYRKKIGMIFQHFNLLSSRTVEGNIAYPMEIHGFSKEEQKKRLEELLPLVHLESKRTVFPARLSGGQKQRVGIARALACHPHVLFSDEATSALDPKSTRDILQLLKELNEKLGLTIVLITHEMNVIKQICNKLAVLDKGKIVELGTTAEIFAEPKHPMTKQFLETTIHEIPAHFFKPPSPTQKLLRLSFKGQKASEPIISHMIKELNVEVNILFGWIDTIEGLLMGNLVIELQAKQEDIARALLFLNEKNIHTEVLCKKE